MELLSDSRLLYAVLVGVVAGLRLVELAVSRRNIHRLRARGAVEVGRSHYPWMVAVHTGWLIACPVEVWLLSRPMLPALAAVMLILLAAGTALRYWVIRTLGERWSTRIVFVPGDPLAVGGPFRWLRHPNYLGVILEIVALPMVHTAWLTAVVFSLANAAVLRLRIADEESALSRGMDYQRLLGDRSRLIPGRR